MIQEKQSIDLIWFDLTNEVILKGAENNTKYTY